MSSHGYNRYSPPLELQSHDSLYDDPGDYCWICEKKHSKHGCPGLRDAQRSIAKAYNRLFPKRMRKRKIEEDV